jgi:hypothetical protein
LFSATGLAVILIWEVFTFELPREPISQVWTNRLWLHTVVVLGIAIATFVGALAGFKLLSPGRILPKKRIAIFGAIFALPGFSLLVFTMGIAGPVIGFIALVVVTAAASFAGGRLLSRHAA